VKLTHLLLIENEKDGELFGKYASLDMQLLHGAARGATMTRASRSASFKGRTSGAEADNHRAIFRGTERHVRLYSPASACDQSPRPVERQPVAHGMEAFQEMVLVSRPKFIAMAHTILRNREDAEDAVQDAFLSGYLHLPSFEGRSALTTWFTRIVVNAALMLRRKRKSAWTNSQPESGTWDDAGWKQEIPTSEANPEVVCAEREALQFIGEALEKMKPALRQAFTMTYCDEMSGPEARALLGVSTATFKSRLVRARRQLLNRVRGTHLAPHGSTQEL
jgi:RNA polymerase sigma-70 factor (ECF subfamily)